MNPKEHILSIRRNYTGENSDINATGEKIVTNLTSILTKAITELARNIYQKDSHFVMELIQNADDNDYENNIKPFLKIILDKNRIIIQNNEIGFKPNNVDAICEIAKSTKSLLNGSKGYIGEKGIGFKSVFRMSNEPQIFSNGYQFRFRTNSSLRKNTVELGYILPEWIEQCDEEALPGLTTIILPYRKKMSEEEKNKIKDIQPDLLLFLNKLTRLEIIDREQNKSYYFEKEKKGHFVRINKRVENGTSSIESFQNYILFERSGIQVPKSSRIEQRKTATQTKIILAFPLNDDGSLNWRQEQSVYAFLPVRKYNFRFLVQADFILTSGRESIDEDNSWNIWLRSELLKTFKASLDAFKKQKRYQYSFQEFIPNIEETFSDFFKPLVSDIIDYSSNASIIPTKSGHWRNSKQVLISNQQLASIFDDLFIKKALGKAYVHPLSSFSQQLISTLKIARFKDEDLIACLNRKQIEGKNDIWFFKLLSYLSRHKNSDNFILKLKKQEFIPLNKIRNRQMLAAPCDKTIFLPLNTKTTYSFESTIQTISKKLFKLITECKNKRLRLDLLQLLDTLTIKKPSAITIVQHYIINRYKTEEWKNGNDQIDHIRYIKDNWIHLKSFHQDIISWCKDKPLLYIGTKEHVRYFTAPSHAYISKKFGNPDDLENLFDGSIDISYIDEEYLKENDKGAEAKDLKKEWYKFFKDLGCLSIPKTEDITKVLNLRNPGKNSILLKLIDKHWDIYKKEAIKNGVKQSWFKQLTEEKCIPYNGELFYPSEIFVRNKTTEAVFGKHVNYYPDKLNSELSEKLGFHSSINGKSLVRYLESLSNNNTLLSKQRTYSIYSQLINFIREVDRTIFQTKKIIFLPNNERWYQREELIWNDYSYIFGSRYGYCANNFPLHFKEFFVSEIGIQERASPARLFEYLKEIHEHLLNSSNIETKQLLNRVLSELGGYASKGELEQSILQEIKRNIWIHRDDLWKNDDDIFYNDNEQLFELFKDEPSLGFVEISTEYIPKTAVLFQQLGIKPVSEAFASSCIELELGIIDEKLTKKIRKYASVLESLIYSKEYQLYEELSRNDTWTELKNFNIYEIPELKLNYTLNEISKIDSALSYLTGNSLYINRSAENKVYIVANELSKFLKQPLLLEFLIIVLSGDENTIMQLLKTKNLVAPPVETPIDYTLQTQPDLTADETIEPFNALDNIESKEDSDILFEDSNSTSLGSVSKPWRPQTLLENVEAIASKYSGSTAAVQNNSGDGKDYERANFRNKNSSLNNSRAVSQRDRDAIGDYGEKLVYLHLKKILLQKYPHHIYKEVGTFQLFQVFESTSVVAELKLLNDKNRVRGGYDIMLKEDNQIRYYEIKTTVRNDNPLFHVSEEQWRFIKSKGNKYTIVRVLNAGDKRPHIVEINDPYRLWKEEKLVGFPINIQL